MAGIQKQLQPGATTVNGGNVQKIIVGARSRIQELEFQSRDVPPAPTAGLTRMLADFYIF